MVSSILLTGRHKIGINEKKEIRIPNGDKLELKNIPFVRYRFNNYSTEDIEFIKETKRRFNSVNIVELNIEDDNFFNILKAVKQINNIAVFVYIIIRDNLELADSVIEKLKACKVEMFNSDIKLIDEFVIMDKSSTLHKQAVEDLKLKIEETCGVKKANIGICGGPWSFINGNASLTAVRARDLLARYSEREDREDIVPSANHEGSLVLTGDPVIDDNEYCSTHQCGCIRYFIYDKDYEAPECTVPVRKESKTKVKVEKTETDTKEPKEPKEKKPKVKVKPKNRVINW